MEIETILQMVRSYIEQNVERPTKIVLTKKTLDDLKRNIFCKHCGHSIDLETIFGLKIEVIDTDEVLIL